MHIQYSEIQIVVLVEHALVGFTAVSATKPQSQMSAVSRKPKRNIEDTFKVSGIKKDKRVYGKSINIKRTTAIQEYKLGSANMG